jgi:UDP-glucose:glycoprotein glucosyltransferase
VGLKASFSSAPYLLELLYAYFQPPLLSVTRCWWFNRETAADENATAYFPLLDRIADGYFLKASTDQELYEQFIQVLKDDGHMDQETLSLYQFALSMRSSAPRLEAHYQYYHTAVEPLLTVELDASCLAWVLFDGKQYCSPSLDEAHGDIDGAAYVFYLFIFERFMANVT